MQSNILSYIPKDIHSNPLIRVEYSPYAKQQVRNIQKYWINDQAVKRKFVEAITIDWAESKDLDDAIWAEKTSFWYRISIHISDVTEAIPIYSPLDLEALKRTTSIYRENHVLNMYPPELSQDLLSLDMNWEKLTLSLDIDLDFDWNILYAEVYESKFRNLKRYDYDNFLTDFINPESNNHNTLHLMYEIALKRQAIRKTSWARMDYDESDRQLFVWEKQEKVLDVNKNISKRIIEEFMIAANISAWMICVKNEIDSVFRIHSALDERAVYIPQNWLHMALATQNYTHFTSPIRRYSDDIIHRVLKLVLLRWEKNPYLKWMLHDICKHINVSRSVIEILWQTLDTEKKYKDKITTLKANNEWVNSSNFTREIRKHTSYNKKLPKVLVEEIIKDIKYWKVADWAWCIWVFLISNEKEIKFELYEKLNSINTPLKPKAVLSILNETKVFSDDSWNNFFKIIEDKKWNSFELSFYFKWEFIFKISDNIWKRRSEAYVLWKLRQKLLQKIFTHFMSVNEYKKTKKVL